MNALLAALFTASMIAVAPNLGILAYMITAALLAVMLISGRALCRALGTGDDPFLGMVTGFVLLSHALLAGNFIVPGAHWQVAAILGLAGLLRLRGASSVPWRSFAVLGLFAALLTFVWCADIAPRLVQFRTTGKLDFWVDAIVHAGTVAEFGSQEAIGRGMVLMADVPLLLYHYASYMPAALLMLLTGISPLDATLLWWVPLGVLIMVCGLVALGNVLGGPQLAALALAALALMPDPARFALGNGFLDFAWLLETGPTTPYSLGIACAALAMMVHWMRDPRGRALALAIGLAAGCFFVRVNTFFWLAPVMVLGAVAGWPRSSRRLRFVLLATGLIGLVAVLTALSWQSLRANPIQFLFSYVEFVQQSNPPTFVDGLYPTLMAHLGRSAAGLVGVGLTLLGTLGPWLPAFLILALFVHRRGQLEAIDALPFLLLVVAAIEILMAPVARNGDVGEFRHRPGPLLVAVISVWSLRFALMFASPILLRTTARGRRIVLAGLGVASLGILNISIGGAKEPRMRWGAELYGTSVAPELLTLAPLLSSDTWAKPRFAVAGLPPTARLIDNAARLVALSGMPAYVSCSAYFEGLGGPIGDEARRRMMVLAHLAEATSLEALQTAMRSEGITYYVVVTPQDASFDPARRGAIGHVGTFAIYAARSE